MTPRNWISSVTSLSAPPIASLTWTFFWCQKSCILFNCYLRWVCKCQTSTLISFGTVFICVCKCSLERKTLASSAKSTFLRVAEKYRGSLQTVKRPWDLKFILDERLPWYPEVVICADLAECTVFSKHHITTFLRKEYCDWQNQKLLWHQWTIQEYFVDYLRQLLCFQQNPLLSSKLMDSLSNHADCHSALRQCENHFNLFKNHTCFLGLCLKIAHP